MLNFMQAAFTAFLTKLFTDTDRHLQSDIIDDEKIIYKDKRKIIFRNDDVTWAYPPIDPHFVTLVDRCGVYTIILSRQPKSLESTKLDYLWDAECECEVQSGMCREYGKVIIQREVPLFIADDDIACPYCQNSRPPYRWDAFTKEQEKVAENHSFISTSNPYAIHELHRTIYWCPICCRSVWGKHLLKKGDEWKLQFIMEQPSPRELLLEGKE